ncbi:MAG: hypothetical protein J0M12_13750, partial [Deltaproteobacteria bacterium]|nr:hypothetical protein [Deltaproteobacteria bacterium]
MDETLRQDATRSSLNDVPTLLHGDHDLTKENLPPEANELRKQGFLDQLLETLACKPSVTFQFQTSDSYPDEAFGRKETEGYRCQSHYVDRSGQFAMSQLYGEIAPRRVQTITDTRYSVSCSDFIAIIF